MKLLDNYFNNKQAIFDYFGYVEDWAVIPIDDARHYYWTLYQNENGSGTVKFADSIEQLHSDEDYYESDIYTQRFLPKWVYPGEEYTMICVDPHVDGNKFLQIFDNAKHIMKDV